MDHNKDKNGKKSNNHSPSTPTKPKRGRPIGAKNKKKAGTPSSQSVKVINKPQDIPEINGSAPQHYSLKGEMTLKELNFIQLYLTGGLTIEKAMIAAGYGEYNPDYRYTLSKKIIEKYEHQTDDHRKIFRAIGAGETSIAMGLLTLAQTAKSEMVRLNAWATLAKCLGLTKEVVEGVEGIQIVINSSRGLAPQPQLGQHRPAQVSQDHPPALPAPFSITK